MITSSNSSSAPCSVHSSRNPFEESRRGGDHAHVRRDGFDGHHRHLVAAFGEERLDRLEVVERRGERVLRAAFGDPGR